MRSRESGLFFFSDALTQKNPLAGEARNETNNEKWIFDCHKQRLYSLRALLDAEDLNLLYNASWRHIILTYIFLHPSRTSSQPCSH